MVQTYFEPLDKPTRNMICIPGFSVHISVNIVRITLKISGNILRFFQNLNSLNNSQNIINGQSAKNYKENKFVVYFIREDYKMLCYADKAKLTDSRSNIRSNLWPKHVCIPGLNAHISVHFVRINLKNSGNLLRFFQNRK